MAASASKRPPDRNIRIQPLLFEVLAANGNNYMEWSINARAYLCAKELDVRRPNLGRAADSIKMEGVTYPPKALGYFTPAAIYPGR